MGHLIRQSTPTPVLKRGVNDVRLSRDLTDAG